MAAVRTRRIPGLEGLAFRVWTRRHSGCAGAGALAGMVHASWLPSCLGNCWGNRMKCVQVNPCGNGAGWRPSHSRLLPNAACDTPGKLCRKRGGTGKCYVKEIYQDRQTTAPRCGTQIAPVRHSRWKRRRRPQSGARRWRVAGDRRCGYRPGSCRSDCWRAKQTGTRMRPDDCRPTLAPMVG